MPYPNSPATQAWATPPAGLSLGELEKLADLIAEKIVRRMQAHKAEILTPEQAAELLHIHPETVRQWCRSGKLPASQLGGSQGNWQISKEAISKLVNEGTSSKSLQLRKRVNQRMGL